ncbi:MAG: glycine oxidase ThiO [Sulfurifustis sp.]
MSESVVVIGGGVIGLLCARNLRASGVQTVVLDRQAVGRESSWAGAGIASPLYPTRYPPSIFALTRSSQVEYAAMVPDLEQTSGIDIEWRQSGLIIADPDRNGPESDARLKQMFAPEEYKFLRATEIHRIEPRLAVSSDALLLTRLAQVRNSRLVKALRIALEKTGVVIQEGREVVGFEVDRGHLCAIKTTNGVIPATRCIVAAGAWTGTLLAGQGIELGIRPIRGEILLLKGPANFLNHVVVRRYRYLVPRSDGHVLVGSTLDDVGFDKSTTEEGRRSLYEAAVALAPGLGDFEITGHWAGLRPSSPDDLPFIGEHPGVGGLFVCAGHYRNGFATGPATARIAVDLVLGKKTAVDPIPFRLDRSVPMVQHS